MTRLFPPGVREPLIREIQLPVSMETCYRRIFQLSPYSAFLNSGTDLDFARYSFIGCDPCLVYRARGGSGTIETEDGVEVRQGDPFDTLEEILASVEVKTDWDEAPFFAGGIGAFAYDLGRHIERLPASAEDNLNLPELVFTVYRAVIIRDRFEDRTWISAVDYSCEDTEKAKKEAEKCIDKVLDWMNRPSVDEPLVKNVGGELESNFTKQRYIESVEKCLEYIHAGDIYQVNLSQQFTAPLPVSPLDYYEKLCEINPAPFSAFMDCDSFRIISSSPERYLLKKGRWVETRPIKGTRPRGATPEEDAVLAAELEGSEKDRAELAMIVDLERNDLGRVCEFGSVKVTRDREREGYATVHHLVATVEGDLKEEYGPVDLLRATFPGGSITGCPKIRAMEIIEELEPTRRSFYTGSIGYIGFDGGMDLNIVIRTLIEKDGEIWFNVGGGIVADSDPEAEYQETLDKGRAIVRALEEAAPKSDANIVGMPRSQKALER